MMGPRSFSPSMTAPTSMPSDRAMRTAFSVYNLLLPRNTRLRYETLSPLALATLCKEIGRPQNQIVFGCTSFSRHSVGYGPGFILTVYHIFYVIITSLVAGSEYNYTIGMGRQLTWDEKKVREWIVSHRGVLSEVAVQYNVQHQFVQAIAYGRSTAAAGHPIEGELRRRGWPGAIRKKRS